MHPLREHLAEASRRLASAGIASPRLTAEVLLARSLGTDRAYLFAHPEQAPAPAAVARFQAWVAQRCDHVPLQYLTGEQEFYGRIFQVSPDVLIPRPETELVLELALELMMGLTAPRIVDVGTGSGCLAVSLALEWPQAQVVATDISVPALQTARANARRLSAGVDCIACDLASALAPGFDLIVSNPPYIAATELAELQPEVRLHEPHGALIAGPQGMEIYERLIPQAARVLPPGGWLVLELGYRSAAATRALLSLGWGELQVRCDLQGIERALAARRTGNRAQKPPGRSASWADRPGGPLPG